MRLRSRGRTSAAAVAYLAIAFLACARPDKPNAERVSLRIGVRPLFTVAPIYIAHAAGLYKEQGLDVELVPIEGVATSVPLLIQGKLDVLPGPVSPSLFNAIQRGGRLRIVADKGQYFRDDCPQSVFVKSRAFHERGGAPRRVSMMRETFNRMFIERALEANGVDPDAVEQVVLPKAVEYEALVSGRIDAANLNEVWLVRALAKGAVPWVRINDMMAGVQYSVIAFGPRLLDRQPEIGARVTIAHLKAMRMYNEGKTERNVTIMASALGMPPQELREICWPRMREDGMIDTTSLIDFQKWAQARGEVTSIVPASQFWDSRFVETANRALRQSR